MRRSVDRVFADSRDSDLADSLRANVSRFAAYKADYVKTTIENILNDASIPAKDKQAYIDANMNAFSQYQATEETTATSRCRTAKQWKEFNDPQRLRLFPNLRWLPSRSIEKRQSHIQFYDHVWSKGDDFWNHNTPGTEWNCKCDVEETDDPVTNNGNMDPVQVPAGLEGNPAVIKVVFTDEVSYIKKARQEYPRIMMEAVRDYNRALYGEEEKYYESEIGKILVDNITIEETTKGAKTTESYFLKQEIVQHIDRYVKDLEYQNDEDIDLGHNN
ncbi:MAG: hypothetical protein II575_10685, partial [Bacteroidales bacterium]|nr:hypothetical protein [Bacteroidales bacterium]